MLHGTTDEIRRQAVALLEGVEIDDLDDGQDETQRYRSLSHGPTPVVVRVEGLEAADAQVSMFLPQWRTVEAQQGGLTYCVVAASEKARDALAQQLHMAGIRTVAITAQISHTDQLGAVYLSTMHPAKGLEFDCVAVAVPKSYADRVEEDGHQRTNSCLFSCVFRCVGRTFLVIV